MELEIAWAAWACDDRRWRTQRPSRRVELRRVAHVRTAHRLHEQLDAARHRERSGLEEVAPRMPHRGEQAFCVKAAIQ